MLDERERPPRPAARLVGEACIDEARMQVIGADAFAGQPTREVIGEQDIGEFRALIGAPPGIVPRALQIIEVKPCTAMSAGGG